jgi:hypothetical protein
MKHRGEERFHTEDTEITERYALVSSPSLAYAGEGREGAKICEWKESDTELT